jgi:hypothetical protein
VHLFAPLWIILQLCCRIGIYCEKHFSLLDWKHQVALRTQKQLSSCHASLQCLYFKTIGGWWYHTWGGLAHSNDCSSMSGMVSNTSNTWFPCVLMPFHFLRCRRYYEPSSPQQPPLCKT